MQLVIHEGASDVPVMVPQGDGKMKVRWTLPEEAKQTIVKLRRVGNQNWYLCTGGAIAAPATETLATGLEEGIEYEAMVSFFINNRWCCESPISKPACIGELKLPAPPTQPKDVHLPSVPWVFSKLLWVMAMPRMRQVSTAERRELRLPEVPPLSGALVRFRAVGARKWLFAHPSSGALIDVSPEKEPDLIPFPQTEVDVRGLPLGIRFEACVAFRPDREMKRSVSIGFAGRTDVVPDGYAPLLAEIQAAGEAVGLQLHFVDLEDESASIYMGHGMGANGGASKAQEVAAARKGDGLILLAGFLERRWRPSLVACAKTWEKQPSVSACARQDGVHDCRSEEAIPTPSYPVPSLSVGGEMDGVVRVSRMAEAWYTQQAVPQHVVKLVPGMSHSDLVVGDALPATLAALDLPSTCGGLAARSAVAQLVVSFVAKKVAEGQRVVSFPGAFGERKLDSGMTQLRYVEISVLQAAAGLNGWAVIKEEKAGVLADHKQHLVDDGLGFVSAREIATKLASREMAWKVCGKASSPELDDGDRCKKINEEPLKMMADRKPTPPAGPWWIWNYLDFKDTGRDVEITSWYAFYPLSGPAYGAGNHYCKLLSPARALEWIYIDSLRPQPHGAKLSLVV
eukprot:g6970.t1